MNFGTYYGDERLKFRVNYSKNEYAECIYCGKESRTREHVPSKTFLIEPFPENLPTLPACLTCNNSFSNDEFAVSLLVQSLKKDYYKEEYTLSSKVNSQLINERNNKLVSNINETIMEKDFKLFQNAIVKILTKLAIGHSVWELSEGYFDSYEEAFELDNIRLSYNLYSFMSDIEVKQFLSYFDITEEYLPELGSRIYSKILISESNGIAPQRILVDWVTVQPAEYIYTCYQFEEHIIVKMVISSFLFAEVIIQVNN